MQKFGIHPALAEALAARRYDTLTTVESAVIEEPAQGRDRIVSAASLPFRSGRPPLERSRGGVHAAAA